MKNSLANHILKPILDGIGYMLPCVVAGGILMGVGFMVDDIAINPDTYGHNTELADFFSTTGTAIFSLMLPVLAAFIARSLSSNTGLAAGFAGGVLASQGQSGFLGALLAGFIAGYCVKFLQQRGLTFLSEKFDGLKNLLLIPLLSVIVMGLASCFIIEPIIGQINSAMSNFLGSMSGSSKIILGLIVGGMQATDMGGPINKTAYLFATASLVNGQYDIMAAVLAGGIVPPYVTAFASTIFKNKFTEKERQAGMANYIIGLAGITEAAIPFLANDPLRVIPSCVIGAGLAGALSMYFSCSVMAPFGGVFIFPLNSNLTGYIFSIALGIIVGTLLLSFSKRKIIN